MSEKSKCRKEKCEKRRVKKVHTRVEILKRVLNGSKSSHETKGEMIK